jgi:hypothetical protein
MPPDQPENPPQGQSPAGGDRRYGPTTTFPRDIGEDGLPVREKRPTSEGTKEDPEDGANLDRG